MRVSDLLLALYSLDVVACAVAWARLTPSAAGSSQRRLSEFFLLLAVALAIWIAWSYRLLNLSPTDTVSYALLESAGILVAVAAVRSLLVLLAAPSRRIERIGTVVLGGLASALVLSKVSHRLLGYHAAAFFWTKQASVAGLLGIASRAELFSRALPDGD